MGPPGSGKGSLSQRCASDLGWQQFSTGNACRKHVNEQTSLGKEIDFIIKSGKMISDDLVIEMVDQWLVNAMEDVAPLILDGFPRNAIQAQKLLEAVMNKYASLKLEIVRFLVSDQVAVNRICNRFICKNNECQAVYSADISSGLAPKNALMCDRCLNELMRRTDDNQGVVLDRIQTYRVFEREILDVLRDYECVEIDVERPMDKIFETFKVSLNIV